MESKYNSKHQNYYEDQEYDGANSSMNNPEDPRSSQFREEIQLKRDDAMTSAYVDSFFLPGGIFELEEEYESSKPLQDAYPKRHDEYYSPVSHPPLDAYEYRQPPVGSRPSHGLDSSDQRINSYLVASDTGQLRSNLNSLSEHQPLIVESRQSHIPHRMDFFHNLDSPMPSDQLSGPAFINKYSGNNAHISGDSNIISLNHVHPVNLNQDISQPSLFSSSLLASSQVGQHTTVSSDESRLYSNMPYHSNNRRDYNSSITLHDNSMYYSAIRSAPSNKPVHIPPNPWRNYSITQQSSSMQATNALGQPFQYVGQSPSDNTDFFNGGNPMQANTTSHHSVYYSDPRIQSTNLIYNKNPTDHGEHNGVHPSWQILPTHLPFAMADIRNQVKTPTFNVANDPSEFLNDGTAAMLSRHAVRSTSSQTPLALPDTRIYGQCKIPSATVIATPNMSTTTSSSTVANSVRLPPGFSSSQTYNQSITLNSATHMGQTISYGQCHDHEADPLMTRQIKSFHPLAVEDTNNCIKIKENGTENPRAAAQVNHQIIHGSEQDARNARDRDLDSHSSRGGVPSTIYFRTNDDEDGVSYSEDTLTACADSIAEYDREYLRRAALNRKDGNMYTGIVEQISEDDRYGHTLVPRNSRQNVDNARDKNDAHKIEIEFHYEEELNYIPDRLDSSPCINSSTDEAVKKQKRKKKVKKISTESVSSRDISNDIVPNIKECMVSHIEGGDVKQRGVLQVETISEQQGIGSDSKDKLRQIKASKMKVSQSPHYLARQQKAHGSAEENPSVPRASAVQKSLMDVYRRHSRTLLLQLIVSLLNFWHTFSASFFHMIIQGSTLLSPSWDRFWFILPIFCFISDLCVSFLCIISSLAGKATYIIFSSHKLALSEVTDNATAVLCYSLSSSFPIVVHHILRLLPSLPSGCILVLWYTVVRVLLSPMESSQTFLARIRMNSSSRLSTKMMRINFHDQVSFRQHYMRIEDSERLKLTNRFLSTLRFIIPLFVLAECLSTGYGFILDMSLSERILLGFGLSVIRMGYIFVPIIFVSWTVQLMIILFFPNRLLQIYSLAVIGFSTIRLSHYASATEDMKIKLVKR